MKTLTRILACTMLAAALTAGTGIPAGGATLTRIAHPTRADVVILHTESSPNMWGGEYRDASDITVDGDGRVLYGDGSEVRVTERGFRRETAAFLNPRRLPADTCADSSTRSAIRRTGVTPSSPAEPIPVR